MLQKLLILFGSLCNAEDFGGSMPGSCLCIILVLNQALFLQVSLHSFLGEITSPGARHSLILYKILGIVIAMLLSCTWCGTHQHFPSDAMAMQLALGQSCSCQALLPSPCSWFLL